MHKIAKYIKIDEPRNAYYNQILIFLRDIIKKIHSKYEQTNKHIQQTLSKRNKNLIKFKIVKNKRNLLIN